MTDLKETKCAAGRPRSRLPVLLLLSCKLRADGVDTLRAGQVTEVGTAIEGAAVRHGGRG